MSERHRDAVSVFALGLAVRLGVVAWGARLFPPGNDGTYYDTFARRLAHGEGYTWLWPDGVVTAASHYPVGYPFLLSLAYRIKDSTFSAMTLNAVLGAIGAGALVLALRETSRKRALLAGLITALHPALVPYTLAVMTEGAATALVTIALALGLSYRVRSEKAYIVLAGITMGVATLVRPQCLALVPLLGAISVARPGVKPHLAVAVAMTSVALLVCAPWTVRNCLHTDKCSLVSANGGWNLLIGTQAKAGKWAPIEVPKECSEVWGEGAKDTCFGDAAKREIRKHPFGWIALMPQKLAVTFDVFWAAPWYLHAVNEAAFSSRAAMILGGFETAVSRLLLLGALLGLSREEGPRRRGRIVVGILGGVGAVTLHAFVGYLALVGVIALFGLARLRERPVLVWTAGLIATTAAVHAVFFGAGRYSLIVAPFVGALAVMVPWKCGAGAPRSRFN